MKAATLTVLPLIIFALTAILCEGKLVFINILKICLSTPPIYR
uniref:Interleukin-8 variant 1 n=1 Tax=Ictalurus punctatus TaxID=7998 RepID=Q8AXZ2_ICTPU|nr:interleukin-8 variant 1 [Ictalurus punctatus]